MKPCVRKEKSTEIRLNRKYNPVKRRGWKTMWLQQITGPVELFIPTPIIVPNMAKDCRTIMMYFKNSRSIYRSSTSWCAFFFATRSRKMNGNSFTDTIHSSSCSTEKVAHKPRTRDIRSGNSICRVFSVNTVLYNEWAAAYGATLFKSRRPVRPKKVAGFAVLLLLLFFQSPIRFPNGMTASVKLGLSRWYTKKLGLG